MAQSNVSLHNNYSETSTLITTIQEEPNHRTYLISRTRCKEKVVLLILVFTAPANFNRRTIIRKTWATDPSVKVRSHTARPVVGNSNIADWVTREKSPTELGPRKAWQKGPDFLRQPVEEWPVSSHANVEELNERYKAVINVNATEKETLQSKLTARILRLYKRYTKGTEHSPSGLSKLKTKDVDAAERFWIRNVRESTAQVSMKMA